MAINSNPKQFVVRFRKGRPILVDKQILRWRKARKRISDAIAKTLHNAPGCPRIDDQYLDKGVAAETPSKSILDLFSDES